MQAGPEEIAAVVSSLWNGADCPAFVSSSLLLLLFIIKPRPAVVKTIERKDLLFPQPKRAFAFPEFGSCGFS